MAGAPRWVYWKMKNYIYEGWLLCHNLVKEFFIRWEFK